MKPDEGAEGAEGAEVCSVVCMNQIMKRENRK